MVGYSQDVYFFAGIGIDNRIWEVLHDKTTLSMEPQRSKQRMLYQQMKRAFEFGKKCLRKSSASPLFVVLGSFPKILLGFRVKRIPH